MGESYWQRGCNEGYALYPRKFPGRGGPFDPENVSYFNGWNFGWTKKQKELAAAKAANEPEPTNDR